MAFPILIVKTLQSFGHCSQAGQEQQHCTVKLSLNSVTALTDCFDVDSFQLLYSSPSWCDLCSIANQHCQMSCALYGSIVYAQSVLKEG